jgi:cob(I)alamin adenosyltransferase
MSDEMRKLIEESRKVSRKMSPDALLDVIETLTRERDEARANLEISRAAVVAADKIAQQEHEIAWKMQRERDETIKLQDKRIERLLSYIETLKHDLLPRMETLERDLDEARAAPQERERQMLERCAQIAHAHSEGDVEQDVINACYRIEDAIRALAPVDNAKS